MLQLCYSLIFCMMIFTSCYGLDEKKEEDFRIYNETTEDRVKAFYKENHTKQTLDFVLSKKKQYLPPHHMTMMIDEAIALVDTIIDESDPDLTLPQSYHLLQTAEAMRKDGQPDWLIVTGLIHDLGKILTFFKEPQWAVVGDTFPLGCGFNKAIVFSEYFEDNIDSKAPHLSSEKGIYEEGCGLDNVTMSWGHDEYLYHVVKDYLPEPALYIIRYHSFYCLHKEEQYSFLLNEQDRKMLPWLKLFSRYDLYSKNEEKMDLEKLWPYYKALLYKFFPNPLNW